MANDAERRGYYKSGYFKLCDVLKFVRRDHPEAEEAIQIIASEYKEWVLEVAEIDNLPDVK